MIDFGLTVADFDVILLIFMRMTGLFILSPVFGRQNMPAVFKIGFSFFLTVIFVSTAGNMTIDYQDSLVLYSVFIVKELAIGMIMGYVTYVILSGIYVAGQLIDTQVGFGFANVLDPVTNIQVPLTSNFYYTYVLLVFLLINGHHMIIRALFHSFEILPVERIGFSSAMIPEVTSLLGSMFIIALRIAAPIMAAIFIVDIVLGVLAKTIPEMNVFMLGMPIKIIVGFIIILITFSGVIAISEGLALLMEEKIMAFFGAMGS